MSIQTWVAGVGAFAIAIAGIGGAARADQSAHVLWYAAPAERWTQALPIGNGRLGAMVFGQAAAERLQLNESTIWSGAPNPKADRANAYERLPELRRLLREGRYADAAKFGDAHFTSAAAYKSSYQTLGDLTFEHALPAGAVGAYRRQLDIGRAVAGVTFEAGGVRFARETFSTAVDQALVHRVAADRPGAVSFTVRLARAERTTTRFEAPATLVMTGDTGGPLKFEVRARVIARNGRVAEAPGGGVSVAAADEATVVLTAATTYALDPANGYVGGDLGAASRQLDAAAAKPFDALLAAHVADYQRFFRRVRLDLGSAGPSTRPADAVPTDERLKAYRDAPDPTFAELFYQYGRYLLISSSRPDNVLPANLQGIWADGLTPPWNADYHTNINVQMNYWPAESSNLGELHLPLVRLTQSLVSSGSKTAQAYFGPDTPGWVCSYTTNAWGWTSPGARLPWGIWWGGSAWLSQHLWEHYAFTRDDDYLRSVYPTMKSASEFWLATLIEDAEGKLIPSPSTSPENTFVTDTGITSTITEGATMDRALVWDLFDNTAKACRVLGTDADFAAKVEAARDRIRPLQIGKAGQLMEWNGDWDANAKEMHHRHVSHLFPLHPGHQITIDGTPELAAAARKSLEIRGDDGTGWSLAWKINFWARLRDGDRANKLMSFQLRSTEETRTVMSGAGGTYPNLFDAHPPFQIDGNFGFVAGVNELLLQSHEPYVDPAAPTEDRYYVDLLPALPRAWPTGSVAGLRARGGFEVALAWADGKLTRATLKNPTDKPIAGRVRAGERTLDVTLAPGATREFDAAVR